ncbi:MAG: site-specific integrase [Clostridia bacterium]|nr:site-specific integrase [Clostridia bacterium]
MTGCIAQRKDVYYVRLVYYDKNHYRKEKWISTGLSGRGARQKATAMIDSMIEKYSYLEKSEHPAKMADYLKMWKELQIDEVAETTFDGYHTYVDRHLIPYFKVLNINIQDITAGHVMDYLNYLSKDGGRKDNKIGGQSNNSIRKIMSILRKVFDYAVLYGDIKINPALQVPMPQKEKNKSKRQVFLTAEEAQKMLDAFQNEEIGPIVFVTLYYGLRKSEALGLRWQAVDFENDTISINHTVVGGSHIVAKDSTKTYCSERTYQLLPDIKALLLKLKDQQADYKRRLGSGYHNNDYIFKNPNGVPYRPDSLTRSFKRALERHGLPQMRYHDLRHSTASILVDKGWDINSIKEWLGHADISTTANIYAHMSKKKKVSLAKDLDKTLTFEQKSDSSA